MGEEKKGPVVVTGAAGYIGSWLVMRLLREGYTVRATVRDPTNLKKTRPLLELPGADERLTIWKADLGEEGCFDRVIVDGCTGVFHVATPMDFDSKDPENEVIVPTVNGVLGILRACRRAGTVRRVVFTSSAGTVNVQERQQPEYDENSWSDVDFCRRVRMTGWMYFVSKTLAEKAAWEFETGGIHLLTVIPPLVVGPFLTSTMPPSMHTVLSLITGNKAHYSILKQHQLVHLDDLCRAHIFLFEHPEAKGRYICSSHDATIFELAGMLQDRYPEYHIPTEFEDIDNTIERVHFSSRKLEGLGFEFRNTMEEMFDGAIQCCKENKLIPLRTRERQLHGGEEKVGEPLKTGEKLCPNGRVTGGEEKSIPPKSGEKQLNGEEKLVAFETQGKMWMDKRVNREEEKLMQLKTGEKLCINEIVNRGLEEKQTTLKTGEKQLCMDETVMN